MSVKTLAKATVLAVLVIWLSGCGQAASPTLEPGSLPVSPTATVTLQPPTVTVTPVPTATPIPTMTPVPLRVRVSQVMQEALVAAGMALPHELFSEGRSLPVEVATQGSVELELQLSRASEAERALAYRQVAAVAPFRSLEDEISSAALRAAWTEAEGAALLVSPETAPLLTAIWGAPQEDVTIATVDAEALESSQALGLVGFEQLDPTLKVLVVDGVNVLSNQFDPAIYPLGVALKAEGEEALIEQLAPWAEAWSNRVAGRLTQLIMTGVTAMCRQTAARMDVYGPTYPAEVVGPVLRQADVTHISNEVPFIEGCVTNETAGNLVFCSDPAYWAALEAVGADIIGLSGNHVNDYGYAGALESLAFYESLGVPVYGSGANVTEACAPLLWEDHGNTFAFIATLAFGPSSAWAHEDRPGACHYYDHREAILESVRALSQQVDVVSVELQYYETYHPFPTAQQVVEFRELRAAGADLVTGVQSHVPQAWEPYGLADEQGPGMILYGLGNLFFDQMYSWQTRTGQIARHTIYQGRLISTEVLTTVLEDYAQPRWATEEERRDILNTVNEAAPLLETGQYDGETGMAIYALELALDHWLSGDRASAAYWGLTDLTDAAFASAPRGGEVEAASWQVVSAEPDGETLEALVAFREVSCTLAGETFEYEGPLYSLVSVSMADESYQVGAMRPQAKSS